jgi:SAM-dependent methyltransferase
MDTTNQYQQMVEGEWLPAPTADAWARWHDKLTAACAAMTARLIDHARLGPGLRVLDVASGTGDPAITLAERVGATGHVVATDLSENMLAVARKQAAGISNISFRVADAQSLPFDDDSFDVVTCRLGIMYFVDVPKALGELRRVLKPGGRIVFAAWGPPGAETYSGFMLGPFFARRQLPMPPADMPFPLRFAAPDAMASVLRAAGLRDVTEENVVLASNWPGPPDEAWAAFYDTARPLRPYIDSFSPTERAQAFQEALAILPRDRDPNRTDLTISVNFAVGTK